MMPPFNLDTVKINPVAKNPVPKIYSSRVKNPVKLGIIGHTQYFEETLTQICAPYNDPLLWKNNRTDTHTHTHTHTHTPVSIKYVAKGCFTKVILPRYLENCVNKFLYKFNHLKIRQYSQQ